MQRYLAGRILQAIVSMLVVSMVVFVLARLTGDPLEIMMPAEATKEDIAMMRAYLGLDRPWPVQYWRFISRAVQGDFSRSVRFNRPALAIAHDLAVVKYVSQQIGVMSIGKLVETAASTELDAHPLHPYTQVLLSNALPSQ